MDIFDNRTSVTDCFSCLSIGQVFESEQGTLLMKIKPFYEKTKLEENEMNCFNLTKGVIDWVRDDHECRIVKVSLYIDD